MHAYCSAAYSGLNGCIPGVEDDALAVRVEAAAAGAAPHLQQLIVLQPHVHVVAAPAERRDDGAAGGHVDARRERLRRKHNLQQASLEEALYEALPACTSWRKALGAQWVA